MKETPEFESLCRLAENYDLAFTLTRHSSREWELNVWRELDAKGTRAHIFAGYGDGMSLIESFLGYDPPTDLKAIFSHLGFPECLIPPAASGADTLKRPASPFGVAGRKPDGPPAPSRLYAWLLKQKGAREMNKSANACPVCGMNRGTIEKPENGPIVFSGGRWVHSSCSGAGYVPTSGGDNSRPPQGGGGAMPMKNEHIRPKVDDIGMFNFCPMCARDAVTSDFEDDEPVCSCCMRVCGACPCSPRWEGKCKAIKDDGEK